MRIQHNIMAMSAYRNYTNNVAAMKKNLEKLSSGYKINRAGDDAAGLAISEKMRAQITGLETAQKNAKDGISLVQTAEGAMTEVHDMLNRMVELATQSANGTYDNDTDRDQLQKELDQLRTEINRIADSSNFNGIKLLDGSMDGEGGVAASEGNFTIPPEGTDMYTETILHKEGNDNDASFKLELHEASYAAKVGDTLKIEIGDLVGENAVEVEITASNANKDLKTLIADALNGKEINGVEVTATKGSGTNNNVSFTVDSANAFQADLNVKLSVVKADSYDPEVATSAVTSTNIGKTVTAALTNTATITGGSISGTITAANLNKALADLGITVPDGATFSITGDGSNGFTLKVGDATVATAAMDTTALNAGSSVAITFKYDDASGAEQTLGTLTVTATGGGAGVTSDALKALELEADGGTISDISYSVADDAVTSDAKTAIGAAASTNVGKVTIAANASGSDFVLKVGDETIAGAAFALSTNTLTVTVGGESFDVTLANDPTGMTKAELAAMLGADGSIDTGIEITAGEGGEIEGNFSEFTTQNVSNTSSANGQIASTTFELTADKIKAGSWIQIGQKKYTFAEGDTNSVNGDTITLTKELLEKGGDELVDMAGELLSRKSDENPDFTIGYSKANNRVSVYEKTETVNNKVQAVDHTDMLNAIEGGNLETIEGFEKLLGFGSPMAKGRGLTLQIGDTADDFNKLTVNIKDMHTAAMGIGDINIKDQDSAADAVKKIKEAINYVSDVRGTLGATQNRLDHTINNLSVMTENIQDAESTIRDVDVAEEMMAYTKNNILIQSAQAMLAQANQVPQGVLQLLQ